MWGKFSRETVILICIILLIPQIIADTCSGSDLIEFDDSSNRASYTYHNYTTLGNDLESLESEYPSIFDLSTAQSDFGLQDCKDGYKIWIVRITNETRGFNKPEVLFIGGHHGNEDVSIETAYYFAEWLVTSYETDDHVRYLIDHREIYIMPVINPWGWENNVREDGNGEDPNRDYPYANTSYNQGLTTIGARAVHELMSRHLFITAISWHSGLHGIYYAWGTPVHDTPTDEAPDTVAFYEQARLMSAQGGNFGGKYEFGPANEVIYGVRGAWSDYAYAASWDTQYTSPEFSTNGSRALAIGVEISNEFVPLESTLGNSNGIYDTGGSDDGWIPKNIRMAIVLVDNAEPYINLKNQIDKPSIAYPGQNITFEWEVMGSFKADETRLNYEFNWDDSKSKNTIDQYKTITQSGWSGWYDNTFKEQVTMPAEEGDYYFVISATVDQDTLEQTAPEPNIAAQSVYVNQRTNLSWEISNNENNMKGQKVWYSDIIHIKVQESGIVYFTEYPEKAEAKSRIQLNWTVGVGSNYKINQTDILWGKNSDPRNESEFIVEGILVNEQVDGLKIICNYMANISMPIPAGKYYFIAMATLDHLQPQVSQPAIWSEVVFIEVYIPPEGYGLEVTTPVVDYSGNLTQKIDIFNIKVSCADLEVDVCDDSMLTVHEFVIYNNENVKLQVGELEWNGENWGAQSINVSSFPEDLYYVTSYFEHNLGNGSNDHISGDTSEFIVDHILIITPPILEVRDGEERYLNITNITAISSYKLPSDLNLGNVTSFKYSIENYTNHWKPIMLGELNWTGDQWQVTNINLSKYGPGQYRVKLTCYFAYDYYDHTEEFNFTYTGDIEKPDQEESSEEVEIPVYYIIIPIIVIILILMLLYISTKDRKNDR